MFCVYAKKHSRTFNDGSKHCVLALCDASLLGKGFSEERKVLDLNANAAFYKGEKIGEKQAKKMLEDALKDSRTSLNVVGKKSVECLKKAMPSFNEENVKKVAGVPHVHVYRV